ncbi:hypothetical protein JL722_651 [Aureococcus anophagefferens]|nr:hypothetical protein JL722_651 [Aureococcus anophagefferens]
MRARKRRRVALDGASSPRYAGESPTAAALRVDAYGAFAAALDAEFRACAASLAAAPAAAAAAYVAAPAHAEELRCAVVRCGFCDRLRPAAARAAAALQRALGPRRAPAALRARSFALPGAGAFLAAFAPGAVARAPAVPGAAAVAGRRRPPRATRRASARRSRSARSRTPRRPAAASRPRSPLAALAARRRQPAGAAAPRAGLEALRRRAAAARVAFAWADAALAAAEPRPAPRLETDGGRRAPAAARPAAALGATRRGRDAPRGRGRRPRRRGAPRALGRGGGRRARSGRAAAKVLELRRALRASAARRAVAAEAARLLEAVAAAGRGLGGLPLADRCVAGGAGDRAARQRAGALAGAAADAHPLALGFQVAAAHLSVDAPLWFAAALAPRRRAPRPRRRRRRRSLEFAKVSATSSTPGSSATRRAGAASWPRGTSPGSSDSPRPERERRAPGVAGVARVAAVRRPSLGRRSRGLAPSALDDARARPRGPSDAPNPARRGGRRQRHQDRPRPRPRPAERARSPADGRRRGSRSGRAPPRCHARRFRTVSAASAGRASASRRPGEGGGSVAVEEAEVAEDAAQEPRGEDEVARDVGRGRRRPPDVAAEARACVETNHWFGWS